MTDENAAPVETTPGTTVDENVNVDQENSVLRGTEHETISSSDTSETTDVNYDWVPDKFMGEEGQPDFENMAKSYKSLESMMSKKGIKPPESIDEYKYDFKNGDLSEDESSIAFRKEALENGVSSDQYSWLMGWFENNAEAVQAHNIETTETTLREDWGDNYDSSLNNAKAAWKEFGGEQDIPPELGNHPVFLKLLSTMGEQLGEDSMMGQPTVQPTGMTALEKEDMMKSDDYWTSPEKQKLVAQYYAANSK